MDDNLYQDDFEEFLKGQVKNHRMYPSDAVWRNINKKLHGEKNWPALTIAAFAILVATVAVCVHFLPKPNIFAVQPPVSSVQKNTEVLTNDNPTSLSSVPFAVAGKNNGKSNFIKGTPIQKDDAGLVAATLPNLSTAKQLVIQNATTSNNIIAQAIKKAEGTNRKKLVTENIPAIVNNNVEIAATSAINTPQSSPITEDNSSTTIKSADVPNKSVQPTQSDPSDKNMVDGFLKEHKNDLKLYTTTQTKSLKNRISYLVYIAPSVSYRKLAEDESALKSNATGGPVALNYVTDVNQVVRHKPGTGLEAGVSILYNLSEKLRLKSGLQFNMRQYNIEAYRSLTEPASIALFTSTGVDTVNTLSYYRTSNGYYAAQLSNRYFQLAVPIGIEWEIVGNKAVQLNLAGSLQPTYLLNKNAYLLSTNFKNYTENSSMINSWNINSNVEAYLSFKVGEYKWQIGPQLRYQHLSTFIHQYPIKEHLMDYGFKLGVSKTIQ
jgi:hypothetical protein